MPNFKPLATVSLGVLAAFAFGDGDAWTQYGGGAQHHATGLARLQSLTKIIWSTPVDRMPQYNGVDLLWHYTPPMITELGTVVVPVKTSATGDFVVEGHRGSDGKLLWTSSTDYILPPHRWGPVIGAALVAPKSEDENFGVVVAASGGTLMFRSSADRITSRTSRLSFYGLANYVANKAAMDGSVFINTPLTVDHHGNVYFGYQVTGANPLNLQSGIARVNVGGNVRFASVPVATGGLSSGKVKTNCGPALSADESTVYFSVNGGTPYLVSVDARTLAPKHIAPLNDPISGATANVLDDGTECPMVAPNGDVFYGVLENPWLSNHDRGYMLHFDKNLSLAGVPGDFGWDDTASLVPSSAVPSYHGTSRYLILTKYNNYIGIGGDGHNKIAILDPFNSQTDPQTNSLVMKEVISVLGVTPDGDGVGAKVREWCVNSSAIDVAGKCALLNSEDGKCYRWDFRTNTLAQTLALTAGIGEAYTTTIIGPNGRGYAISNASLYVVGSR